MNKKIKNFFIPFVLMLFLDLGNYFLIDAVNFGGELNPHLGILFIAGLFFGPYGALGAVLGNFICDIVRGYSVMVASASLIISFLISYLVFKVWYTKSPEKHVVTKPRLKNTYNLLYLISLIIASGLLYSILTANVIEMCYPAGIGLNYLVELRYFANFVNFALLCSIICILICKYYDFSYTPEISEKTYNAKWYRILYYLIAIVALINIILDSFIKTYSITLIVTVTLTILIYLYTRKPIKEVNKIKYLSIPEKMMLYFLTLTLIVLIIDMLMLFSQTPEMMYDLFYSITLDQPYLYMSLILDGILVLFFIPALVLVTYVEGKIIKPIKAFSTIESYIRKDEKIESEGILDIYSDYLGQDDEIGILSRSYTNLIKNNNEYIENMERLEGERQRIKAELNIAHNIQKATLPKKSIDNRHITVDGFCKPAKEVGGDFYDFYELDDENTMIIIGDASGKGVPAAIFTIITQNSIKLLVKNDLNPAKVLCDMNNQICENNPEMMFITLFLAIYNNKTHMLTYANAGHNPPIIKDKDKYRLLNVDSEIVLGVMEDYEYENHEILLEKELILYTDGITDSQNKSHELYGEDRLINCLNNTKPEENMMNTLLNDIDEFSEKEEQFDDMTLLILKVKQ